MGECDRSGSEPHTESGVISPKSRREDDGDSDEDGEDGEDVAERMLSISPNRRVRDDADGDEEDIGDVVWCGIVI